MENFKVTYNSKGEPTLTAYYDKRKAGPEDFRRAAEKALKMCGIPQMELACILIKPAEPAEQGESGFMDIAEEKLMERIAVALERIAAALEVGKEAVLEASEDPATFPHTEKTPEKKEISNNEAMAALESFIKREGKKAAKDLLAAFGVERFSEILPEYYYDFWMACNGKA